MTDPDNPDVLLDDEEDQEDEDHLEPYDAALLPEHLRALTAPGSVVMRCKVCGDVRAEAPNALFDPWKNHWPDECEAIAAAGGRPGI
ncbi:hypothetical protein [Streptomyces sp. NRRL S-1896]|uniref:hypothetical protein n=1 Tax=Streptomyces sp. NRRL S-1896 TaxID=1463893 RepID=UPI0004CD531C|nr:hypothetical protein [Streptomyces sp. NRRL S-1896]